MQTIGYDFKDISLLEVALTHSSYANEQKKGNCCDNERMEFLGDAVLELSSSDYIYKNHAEMAEGKMTRLRASIVCEPTLALCARAIKLDTFIRLGKGEELTGGRSRDSIVSRLYYRKLFRDLEKKLIMNSSVKKVLNITNNSL